MSKYVPPIEQLVTEIVVTDIKRSTEFYCRLGFEVLRDGGFVGTAEIAAPLERQALLREKSHRLVVGDPRKWRLPGSQLRRGSAGSQQESSITSAPSGSPSFGGWRAIKDQGGWYALDGTHPAAQNHLETAFGTMRNEWGVTYFKLDANFWGAMHGGRFYDPQATRIEGYRRGMRSVIKGAGDAFILGCNHPIWASMGLIHGSRSSNDIKRTWDRVRSTALQNLNRNWQNGRLWWNDPDAVCLMGELPDNEFEFHATAIYASGGMILSGDDLTKISGERLAMLKKLLPPQPVAATFADDSFRVGNIERNGVRTVCVFNWEEAPQTFSILLPRSTQINNFWSGEDLGTHRGTFLIKELPAHSAKVLVCK